MDANKFAETISKMAIRDVADSEVASFLNPSGRRPPPWLLELSAWYKGLSQEDRVMAHRAIARTARHAVFRFCVILDNLTGATDEEGYFELRFVRPDGIDVIAGPAELESLHDLLE